MYKILQLLLLKSNRDLIFYILFFSCKKKLSNYRLKFVFINELCDDAQFFSSKIVDNGMLSEVIYFKY